MKSIFDVLRDPLVDSLDVDADDRLILHSKVLARKRMLREVFTQFHHIFRRLDDEYFSAQGIRLEIGAGVSPMRDSYPDVLATDVVNDPHLDKVLDAENMELDDASVRVIYAQNCFHHFPNPTAFLDEVERVLLPGGGVVLLEPYYGPIASFLYKRLFPTEGFDKECPTWETPVKGPMHGANQALSYIVFIRDREEYERKYPGLKIVHQELAGNYLKYLLSGGLNFRQLLPNSFTVLVSFIERLLSPFNRWTALHHVIVLRNDAI